MASEFLGATGWLLLLSLQLQGACASHGFFNQPPPPSSPSPPSPPPGGVSDEERVLANIALAIGVLAMGILFLFLNYYGVVRPYLMVDREWNRRAPLWKYRAGVAYAATATTSARANAPSMGYKRVQLDCGAVGMR